MRAVSFVVATLAVVPNVLGKSAVISFADKDTPDSIVQKAKDDIIAAGGTITHTYNIIKGFAVEAPEDALAAISAWGTEHKMTVEADQEMSINSGI
ncbi:hypothetical protein GMORB2_1184 [Geosmithia morbida]|uniref:Proteinase inhibitor, propeptide n=1 Tax=Geosmithia morbida TaxID=1094350 RepID=A0A9P4Z294_9HYPO|nr:uncharacterized protein GMORB2_1184 [Geosmithia morbida]KAF4125938.1 hypothetical protein GMORB2_1184 [Geosmithia morbida]